MKPYRAALRVALAASAWIVLGCDPEPAPAGDASLDARSDGGREDGGPDGGVMVDAGDAGAPIPLPCEGRVAGEGAFAVLLSGSGEYVASFGPRSFGVGTEGVTAYFPEGRAPGAPFVVAHSIDWPWGGVAARTGTLDGTGSGTFSVQGSSGGRDFSVSGELRGPDDGAWVTASRNFARPDTDVAETGVAQVVLCPSGGPPEPVLRFRAGEALSPLSTLHVISPVPWRDAPALRARDGAGVEIPIVVESAGASALAVRAASAFPPGVSISWSIVDGTDALGRELRIEGSAPLPQMLPPVVLADPTFTTEPSRDAIAVTPDHDWAWDAERGALVVGATSGSSYWANPLSVVLALGAPSAGATRLRVQQNLWCRSLSGADVRAAVVDAAGVATPLALPCAPDDAWISVDVALHGAGPLWLVMVHEPVPDRPQWLYGSRVVTWAIDEIAFAP